MTANRIQPIEGHPRVDAYRGYAAWKGWTKPFAYSAEDAAYFTGETSAMRIAGADVLEIGFGPGNFLAWARDRGARVAGTEINPGLLAAARAAGIELLPRDLETAAGANAGRFDTIAAFDVFEHLAIDEIAASLRAIERMLKPGGKVILRFPNAQSPFGLAPQHGDPTHKSALSRGVFDALIQGSTLAVVRYRPAFRAGGGTLGARVARKVRSVLRDLIALTLNFVYAQNIPWDPVVVLVLRKVA
jgi:SAM-dependent methyltransferase